MKSKLALYRKKRDFAKTAEPSGKVKIASAECPHFLIQKHAATPLHYDLRLEALILGTFRKTTGGKDLHVVTPSP